MEKDYSLIDLRLIELRQHCWKKITSTVFISSIILTLLAVIFSLPIFTNIFYSSFFLEVFKPLYSLERKFFLFVNLLYLLISILIMVLVFIIEYFVYNRKYQTIYKDIILNELKLIDYSYIDYHHFPSKEIQRIIKSLSIKVEINENIASIRKENNFYLNHLYLKEKGKEASLYMICFNEKVEKFMQIDTTGNHIVNEFEKELVFDFYYDHPKYPNKIIVFSSFGKDTNSILNRNLISEINHLQNYFNSKITISVFDNYIALYVPDQKIKLSQSLNKKYHVNLIDRKINTIEHIYNSLSKIFNMIITKGE